MPSHRCPGPLPSTLGERGLPGAEKNYTLWQACHFKFKPNKCCRQNFSARMQCGGQLTLRDTLSIQITATKWLPSPAHDDVRCYSASSQAVAMRASATQGPGPDAAEAASTGEWPSWTATLYARPGPCTSTARCGCAGASTSEPQPLTCCSSVAGGTPGAPAGGTPGQAARS